MVSNALSTWRQDRAARLDVLFAAHPQPGDAELGRQINAALVIQLSAEFQGFARNLYDELAVALLAEAAEQSAGLLAVVRFSLGEPRALDRGNPHPGALGKDFLRFGVPIWRLMTARDVRNITRRDQLERLIWARNAVAHGDREELQRLRQRGVVVTLPAVRAWRRCLDQLARQLDNELAEYYREQFDGRRPW